jgi:hypothetical protein
MAEELTSYLEEKQIKVTYLHSDIITLNRQDVLDNLRLGKFDVLVGINLLREGLDLPEVSLVVILDADKEGFLRSRSSLIQTMGRAARHVDSQVILYADRITKSMQGAIEEVERRREIQMAYNKKQGITPISIEKEIRKKLIDGEALRKDILKRTGLSVSAGIGPSKLLAKMASEYRKPGGVTVVDDQSLSIQSFLRDRPATAIPGIGHARSVHCERMGWVTAWDIACANNDALREHFGRPGIDLKRELNGEVLSGVCHIPAPPKSISRARSFHAIKDHGLLWAHVLRHLEYTVLKMRRQSLAARGLSLWLRDSRYSYESTHVSLTQPLDTEEHLQPYVTRCFKKLWNRNMGYTQAGLSLWGLQPRGDTQLSLFEDPAKTLEDESLQKSLDEVHDRFGRDAVTRASALPVKSGTKRGFEMPEMESVS